MTAEVSVPKTAPAAKQTRKRILTGDRPRVGYTLATTWGRLRTE